jgi:hypothetical protein
MDTFYLRKKHSNALDLHNLSFPAMPNNGLHWAGGTQRPLNIPLFCGLIVTALLAKLSSPHWQVSPGATKKTL